MNMPKTPGQHRISRDEEDSPNRSKRTGRDDGTGGGQRKIDTTSEPNVNKPNRSVRPTYDSQGRPVPDAEFDVQSPNKKGNRIGAQDL
jgi:hypothetical protein